jgi:hypothetical protein
MEIRPMQNEPIEVTIRVTRIFEDLQIPYLIGGSLASALYGMVRTTQDSDIVALMQLEHIQPFIQALGEDFFLDDEMISDAIRCHTCFNIIHRTTMFKVDVFVPVPRPFLFSQINRAKKQVFLFESEMSAKFCSPEDIILAKLEWYRLGGESSERQWRDILGVLKTRTGELDQDYLRKWAENLNIGDLLDRVLQNQS